MSTASAPAPAALGGGRAGLVLIHRHPHRYFTLNPDRVEMIASGSSFVASTIPISYNMTYTSALSGTQSAGLGIVGFTTLQTLDMSMNASIVDFTATYIHIDARALDTTTVTYMAVHYIAIGALSYFVEMQYVCSNVNIQVFCQL